MSTQQANKALVRRHFADALHDPAVCDAIYTPDLAQAIKQGAERLKAVWSDSCQMTVDEILAEEDRVMVRWTFYGVQQGEFAGLPATHRQVRYGGVNIFRIADGKIIEIWDLLDRLSLWQQLGVLPEIKDAIANINPKEQQ
ncbi:MAG: ester cyclase [Caldilineaceae bacterium]